MIQFVMQTEDETVYGIGLSQENIHRLVANDPIYQKFAGAPNTRLFIFMGEDEESMRETLRKKGLIGPDTEIREY